MIFALKVLGSLFMKRDFATLEWVFSLNLFLHICNFCVRFLPTGTRNDNFYHNLFLLFDETVTWDHTKHTKIVITLVCFIAFIFAGPLG